MNYDPSKISDIGSMWLTVNIDRNSHELTSRGHRDKHRYRYRGGYRCIGILLDAGISGYKS